MTPNKRGRTLTRGIRDVKAHLSHLLKEVQSGGEVVITDRGRPVGRLVGVPSHEPGLEERLQRLGWLEPLTVAPAPLPPLVAFHGASPQQYLQEDRGA